MDNLFTLISKTSSLYYEYIVRELEKNGVHGLVVSHGAILMALSQKNGFNYKELSEMSGKSPQTVTTLIRKLEKNEYVTVNPDQNDKRNKIVRLTKKGEDFMPVMNGISKELYKQQYKDFSFEETLQLRELMEKLKKNLNDI